MALIFETDNFIVESHDQPFITREEGGHIRIRVKNASISDRTELGPKTAVELMRLTMIVGRAFLVAMNNRGIPVVKINYQDMGNWAYKTGRLPFLHVHVFGRASSAKIQLWPESVYLPDRSSGFYDKFIPLNEEDREEIFKQINIVQVEDKYNIKNWSLL